MLRYLPSIENVSILMIDVLKSIINYSLLALFTNHTRQKKISRQMNCVFLKHSHIEASIP